jgi:hypothetical protein
MPPPNTQVQLAYQNCPILLSGGSAAQVPGAVISLLNLIYGGQAPGTPLSLPLDIGDLDNAFAAFNVLPGGQLILQQIGQYPFANQSVAANAVVREPLNLSVIMDTPMRGKNPWTQKQITFTALKAALEQHNNKGGLYIVATPAYIYENLIMTSLTDSSRANNTLPQNAWRFDFEKPLVALTELQGALSQLTAKITNGLVTDGQLTHAPQTPAQSAQPQNSQTYVGVPGALVGGPPAFMTDTSPNLNYPPRIPGGGFPYRGIS